MTLWHNVGGKPGLRVRLHGLSSNPLAIGTQLRIIVGTARGPLREVHAGSGYWSVDATTQVMALPAAASALWVRWPSGQEETVPLTPGQQQITLIASK